ncbi:MAG: hypothetical protein AAF591_10250 [Verrucomicrobiota bacterium]
MEAEEQEQDSGGEVAVDSGGPIECKVTPWYFRRMGLMTLMLVGMATYFLYDGAIGYPKKNRKADVYDAFMAAKDEEEEKSWEDVVTELDLTVGDPEEAEHVAKVKEAYDASEGGETWKAFSLERKLPEKPERMTDKEIEEQFHFAWGLYVIGGIVVGVTLMNSRKKVRADGEAYYTTKGKRVPFDGVYRIDKRKWDNKGLAYAYYEDEKEGKGKAVIDDLKFGGADKILARMLADFDGELVERVYIDEDEEEDEEAGEGGEEGVGEREGEDEETDEEAKEEGAEGR